MSKHNSANKPANTQENPSNTGRSHASGPPLIAGRRDYAVLGLLSFINVLNFVDRQLLASFANFIVPDLELSNTQFGLLTGFGFIVFYSVMGLFMGALADRLHRPKLLAFGLAMWSALTMASGAARGFVTLLIPRMLIGVGESVATPTSMSILADRFPARQLGLAAGIYYLGVPIGVAVSLLIAGYLGPTIGWRNCFFLLGGLGLVVAMAVFLLPETPRRGVTLQADGAVEKIPFREVLALLWKTLKASPALSSVIAGGVVFQFILGAAAFDQLWFVKERGFERAEIAVLAGWLAAGGGLLGNLAGGYLGDLWQTRMGSGRPMFLFWAGLLLTPFGIAYRLVPGEHMLFELGIFLGFFQLGLFYGPTFATVQELAPARIRATIVAFYILVLNFVGLGIGITGGGIMIDMLAARGVAAPYTVTLVAFTLISTLALPLNFIAGRLYHRDMARLAESG